MRSPVHALLGSSQKRAVPPTTSFLEVNEAPNHHVHCGQWSPLEILTGFPQNVIDVSSEYFTGCATEI